MSENDLREDVLKQQIKAVPTPEPEIGINTNKTLLNDVIEGAQIGALDISSIDALSNSAQTREQTYELLDAMAQDDVVSAVLETYAEDTVQTNDKGQTIWVESSDSDILNYTTWLMDSLNIDKHLYQWTYCLVTYGDVYVRLYRKSDYGKDLLFKDNKHNRKLNEAIDKKEKDALKEDVLVKVYEEDDPYIPYVEMVPNPGEMFDLQKFGKCYGYIKAPIRVVQQTTDQLYNYLTRYKMKQKDVEIYDATSYVHACLENTTQRQPETVDIYLEGHKNDYKIKGDQFDVEDDDYESDDSMTTSYAIKRGQSILYNSFRIWRELNLLEMSALLNRITQSSVVRVLNIDVGDMPKEQVQNFLQRLKEKIEQKSALNVDTSMGEYTNAGPIINTIYIPTHGTQGQISSQTIGGDFDPKALTDIEYFRDKLFGSLKVPKQFFGFTEDGAGFNGGTSLTILSSRYGKSIKKLQNLLCQMVTDIINLFLIDRGLNNYVNKFTVRMQTPATQEELDRRTNTDNRIRYVGDIMQQLVDIEDTTVKLNILKSLLSDVINDAEVINYIQQYIDQLEKKNAPTEESQTGNEPTFGEESSNFESEFGFENEAENEQSEETPPADTELTSTPTEQESFNDDENKEVLVEKEEEDIDSYIPSPSEIKFDALNNKKQK